ncbi:MAG: membrane protein insertase YidC [candidate division WOR-3 bacterium]|nr:membrane protein insertase YidC [candidate division WOR-3 bacterium]
MSNRLFIYLLIAFIIFFLWMILFPSQPYKTKTQSGIKLEVPVAESILTYENSLYKVEISKKGGFIKQFYTKKYKQEILGNYPLFIFKDLKDKVFNSTVRENEVILTSEEDTIIYTFYDNYQVQVYSTKNDIISYGLFTPSKDDYERKYSSFIYYENKWHNISESKLFEKPYQLASTYFSGTRSHYFAFVILDSVSNIKSFLYDSRVIFEGKTRNNFKFYIGPIDPDILKRVDKKLGSIYDWGFFLIAPFSQLTFYSFRAINYVIHNYGFVIIIFSILIKLIFSPLTYSTYKTMKKLSKIQPEIQKLQVIYKDDPQKLQQEILRIYQQEKVNPFSGCLPLLIQLPIFFAIYQVLVTSIDFKNAQFILWIKDLSSKDPYYILPVLTSLISLVNTILHPSSDKNAKIIGIMMSVLFLLIFLTLPSGLVLYWLTYSLISILEQFIFKSFLKGGN